MRTTRTTLAAVCLTALGLLMSQQPASAHHDVSGKDWTRIPTKVKTVALTFDCGSNDEGLPLIYETLRDKGVPATFFVTGRFAKAHPKRIQRMAARKYVIGNHSWSHPDMTRLSDAAFARQITRTQSAIAANAPGSHPWFRFPYGARRIPLDVQRANDLGYATVRWTVDTLGWQGTSGGMTRAKVKARVLNALTPGEIVLMHCGSHPTDGSTLDAHALASTIAALRKRGYGFTTVEALWHPHNPPTVR